MAFPLMKKLLVIVLLLLAAQLQAQVRMGREEAFASAERFLEQNGKQDEQTLTLSEEIKSNLSGQTNLFVFSVEPQGFIVVSALGKVMAYSYQSNLPTSDELPDHITYWLNLYNQQTDYLVEHPEQVKEPSKSQQSVEPLLTCIWGQGCYHNAACPVDAAGPCQHAEAGCIAIAMAQIMYYHKQPRVGNGMMSYSCPPYGTLSANFGNTTYHWEEMADTLHESNPAVAELVFHCGVSVKMNYGPNLSLGSNTEALNAFHQFFSYLPATYYRRIDCSDETWLSMIRDNLDQQLPVYYAGVSNLGGHAFVCDGYDSSGLFHFNFGWDGVADGYYTLNSPQGFSDSQSILCNLLPTDAIPIHSDSLGVIHVSSDGIGDGSSWEQATAALQAAIYKSSSDGCSVWVKEGIYQGATISDYAFRVMPKGKLFGGFKGDEPPDYDLSLRDFEAHPTILDGNHTQGVISVFSYSVNDTVLIDGFTIRNGEALQGGGILLNNYTHIRNCKIYDNHSSYDGGGLSQHTTESSRGILVEDCELYGNNARNGGAIKELGSVTFNRCRIHDNTARHYGGGIYCSSSSRLSQYINCTICNNTAQLYGGGIYANSNTRANLWSCLINNNTSNKGGGCYLLGKVRLYNCTVTMNEGLESYGGIYASAQCEAKNCILWGNSDLDNSPQIGPTEAYSYCAVTGTLTNSMPNFHAASENDGDSAIFYVRFNNPSHIVGSQGYDSDWQLRPNSLCIDRVVGFFQQPATDLVGNPRLRHRNIDLGAYESDHIAYVVEDFICEGASYYYNEIPITDTGIYTFPYPGQPYDSLVILMLSLNTEPLPELLLIGDTLVDYGTYATLSVSGADTYLWSTGETTQQIMVFPYDDQTYTVTGFFKNGCSSEASITIRVNKEIGGTVLFPNPANNEIHVHHNQIEEVWVYNILGQPIERLTTDEQPITIDVSKYANGMYFLLLKHHGELQREKFIVSH